MCPHPLILSRYPLPTLFEGSGFLLGSTDARHVELDRAVEFVDTVLFLKYVGELGVAVAEHAGVIQQHGAQALETVVKSFQRGGA